MYLCNVRQGQTLAHTTSLGLQSQTSNLYINGNNNKDFQRKEVHLLLQWRSLQEFDQGFQVCMCRKVQA